MEGNVPLNTLQGVEHSFYVEEFECYWLRKKYIDFSDEEYSVNAQMIKKKKKKKS